MFIIKDVGKDPVVLRELKIPNVTFAQPVEEEQPVIQELVQVEAEEEETVEEEIIEEEEVTEEIVEGRRKRRR